MPVNLKIWPHKLLLISTIAFMILLGISMILPMKLQTVKIFCRVIMRYHTLCVWFTQFCYPYKGGQRLIDKRGGMAKGRWRGHEAIEAKTSWLSLLYAPCIIGVCPEYHIGVCPEGPLNVLLCCSHCRLEASDRVGYIASRDSSSRSTEYGWSTDIVT